MRFLVEAFQLGHFFAEMDRNILRISAKDIYSRFNWATSSQKWIDPSGRCTIKFSSLFQLGHFFAEMDRLLGGQTIDAGNFGFNWATSSQKWIEINYKRRLLKITACFNWATSSQKWIDPEGSPKGIPPNAFQLGHFFAEMDRPLDHKQTINITMFQLGHFFAEMDRYG